MNLHLKEDSRLIDHRHGRHYVFEKGLLDLDPDLAKYLIETYPDKFEEKAPIEVAPAVPYENQETNPENVGEQSQPQIIACPVCGKEFDKPIGLIGHRRTHAKGITTADLYK